MTLGPDEATEWEQIVPQCTAEIRMTTVLAVYCCIANYPQAYWFKINMYLLTVSVGQEFRHGLIWFSGPGCLKDYNPNACSLS
jgi:hypothetical protein